MREGQGVKAISCLLSAMLQGQKSLRQNKDLTFLNGFCKFQKFQTWKVFAYCKVQTKDEFLVCSSQIVEDFLEKS